MPLESATFLDELVATNPPGSDPKSQGDDHIRLLKAVLKATFPNMTAALDLRSVLRSRGVMSPTQDWNTLFAPGVYHTTLVAGMTNDPSETYSTLTAGGITLVAGAEATGATFPIVQIFVPATATNVDDAIVWRVNLANSWSPWQRLITALGANMNGPLNYREISAVASATLNLQFANSYVFTHAAGTLAITSLNGAAVPSGAMRFLRFSISGGSLSITHNATTLQIPGAQNIPLTDGDQLLVRSLGGNNWSVLQHFSKARPPDGGIPSAIQLLTGAGNFIVPAGIFRIKVTLVAPGGGGAGAEQNGAASSPQTGGGAGGAGEARVALLAVTPGQSIAYNMGTPGTGGTSGNPGAATSGGNATNATFGSLTAVGGKGGRHDQGQNRGGEGGSGGSGGIGFSGGGGAAGHVAFGSHGQTPGAVGGSSLLGGAPAGLAQDSGLVSTIGAPGTGGQGGCSRGGNFTNGQAGRAGTALVEY